MHLVSIITCSLCCGFSVSLANATTNISQKLFAKMTNEESIYSHSIQKQMQSGIKELALTRLSELTSTCIICDFFYNSILTKFCGLDVSLCFNVFDSNIDLTPSVFQKSTSDYKNKVIILANIPGYILDLYCIRLSNASTFC